jgi:threonine synthase
MGSGRDGEWTSYLGWLECGLCGTRYDADQLIRTCTADGRPLLARYDLTRAKAHLDRDRLQSRSPDLWRYRELLPVREARNRISLGEGMTPLLTLDRLGHALGIPRLLAKDECRNPTGSFKDRGMAVAVSRAVELGARTLAVPSAGNAGVALAAFAARAGIGAIVVLPEDAPESIVERTRRLGATVKSVAGTISDAGRLLDAGDAGQFFNVSTLKEPYRVEGKKTMGFEIAEQLGWKLPDVIVYPTGGGTGIVGMWKAFSELEELTWIDSRRPRFVMVQAEGCAPMAKAFEADQRFAEPWPHAATIAWGLRVPQAIGDFLILEAVRASHGGAVTVSDSEILEARNAIAAREGLIVGPEAAAAVAAVRPALESGLISEADELLLLLTGA